MEKLSDYPNAKLHDCRLPYPFTRYALVIPDKYNQTIVDLKTGKSPKCRVGNHGYKQVHVIDDNGKCKTMDVHRLVIYAVTGEIIPKDLFVLHLDETRENNSVSNLGLGTNKENSNFTLCKKRKSKANKGKNNPCFGKRGEETKKPVKAISIEDGTELSFESIREAGRNGFNSGSVSACCTGRRRVHKGYVWKYIK